MKPEWFENFFDDDYIHFHDVYLPSELATKFEVAFIEKVLDLRKSNLVLDLGCGLGRITMPLAKRGIKVIGVDISPILLAHARRHAEKNKNIKFIREDMRYLDFDQLFDKGFSAFSSFGYFKTRAEDNMVLESISRSLKPKGLFLFDLPNKDFILNNFQKSATFKKDGFIFTFKRFFERADSVVKTKLTISGKKRKIVKYMKIRLYNFNELSAVLFRFNFHIEGVWSGVHSEKFDRYSSKRMFILVRKHK